MCFSKIVAPRLAAIHAANDPVVWSENPIGTLNIFFNFAIDNKLSSLNYKELENNNVSIKNEKIVTPSISNNDTCCEKSPQKPNMKKIWSKLSELKMNLKMNNASDKKSACFWNSFSIDFRPQDGPQNCRNSSPRGPEDALGAKLLLAAVFVAILGSFWNPSGPRKSCSRRGAVPFFC